MSEANHRRVDELVQQDLQEAFEKECEEEGAKASVRDAEEQERIQFTTQYLDDLVTEGKQNEQELAEADDLITNSDFSEDEKTLAEVDVSRKLEVVESQAKRLRMEALQRNPSDEAMTAAQMAAHVQPCSKKIVLDNER